MEIKRMGVVTAVIGAVAGIIVGTILMTFFRGYGGNWLPWVYYIIPILYGLESYHFGEEADGLWNSIWQIIKTILGVFLIGLAIWIIVLAIIIFIEGGWILAIALAIIFEPPVIWIIEIIS